MVVALHRARLPSMSASTEVRKVSYQARPGKGPAEEYTVQALRPVNKSANLCTG